MSNKGIDLNNLGDFVIDTSALEDVGDTSGANSSSQVAMPTLEADRSSAVNSGTAAAASAQQWPTSSTGGQQRSQQQQLQARRRRQTPAPQPAGRNTTQRRGAAGASSSMEAALKFLFDYSQLRIDTQYKDYMMKTSSVIRNSLPRTQREIMWRKTSRQRARHRSSSSQPSTASNPSGTPATTAVAPRNTLPTAASGQPQQQQQQQQQLRRSIGVAATAPSLPTSQSNLPSSSSIVARPETKAGSTLGATSAAILSNPGLHQQRQRPQSTTALASAAAIQKKKQQQEEDPRMAIIRQKQERQRRKEAEEKQVEEERKRDQRRYLEDIKRYERRDGISHEAVMREQTFINSKTLKEILDRQCTDNGLRETDEQADHSIFECLTQAVQVKLNSVLEEIVKISKHRRHTSQVGGRDQSIRYNGARYPIKVCEPKPKRVLAVLRKQKMERDNQDIAERAAIHARTESEKASMEEDEREGDEDGGRGGLRRSLTASGTTNIGRQSSVGGGGILPGKKTQAYLSKRFMRQGSFNAMDISEDDNIGGEEGKVTREDVIAYLRETQFQSPRMRELRENAILSLRYQEPKEEHIKMFKSLKNQVEAKMRTQFRIFDCIGVMVVHERYYYVAVVDGGFRINITIEDNRVTEITKEKRWIDRASMRLLKDDYDLIRTSP